MPAHIRTMREADVSAVVAIEVATFSDPWTTGMYLDELGRPESRRWIVAESEGEVLGFAGIWIAESSDGEDDPGHLIAHLLDIAVRADLRGRGLGRALLAAAMEKALEADAPKMTLEVRPSNTAAVGLYERGGFEPVGGRRAYYGDTGEDALLMATGRLDTGAGAVLRQSLALEGLEALAAVDADDAHPRPELILAIETSCDETAAAVIHGGSLILSSVVATQIDFHARFGGVVPEIASRKHTEAIVGVVDEAMEQAGVRFADLTAIAVTHGPGLVGALVVGLAYAKGLSLATGKPLVGVNHLEAHIFASVLDDDLVVPPLVALVVSGGHTSLVHMPAWGVYRTLGATLDDATGEAFDKVAKFLGLSYPGGPVLSALAADGDPAAIAFPRAMMNSGNYDFSLSGLKTAVINHIRAQREAGREIDVPDLAASFQAAIIDVQVAKTLAAVRETGVKTFVLGGGVAANLALREALTEALVPEGVHVSVPPLTLCTDNAAMVAAAAHFRLSRGDLLGLDAEVSASLPLDTV
jgi:N6-L-threonylcarbamoyladenine synthase/protein kinase Bud32